MMQKILKEDFRLSKLSVRFSNELKDKIVDIWITNICDKEGLSLWYEYFLGMIRWISNPVVAWDNTNKYYHDTDGTTRIVEHVYDVSFLIKTNRKTGKNYIFIFDMKLNYENFGLKRPPYFMENIDKQNRLDKIITETLNRVIRESILAENRKRKVLG